MKTLSLKFFEVLERKRSLEDFRDWLHSLENREELKSDRKWKPFFNFNFGSGSVGYEFSKLLNQFDTDEYARFKFEDSLRSIMADGNLFRIVRSSHDFDMRYNYPAFGFIGDFDKILTSSPEVYETVRQQLAEKAELVLMQWESLASDEQRTLLLKGEIEMAESEKPSKNAAYERFSGRLWKVWKN